jgi:prophage antirepressor-like protein
MPEEEDHLTWRMDPLGWDKEDRSYYVLDDNRMYRRTDARPPPPLVVATPKPKPKAKSKKPVKPRNRGTRSSKRFKAESEPEEEDEEMVDAENGAQDETIATVGADEDEREDTDFGFTSNTWECIAITLEDYQEFLATIFRSRDANEKQLRQNIENDVLPILEKRAEAIRQKQLRKLRELENVQKMTGAKRSSRLAVKADREKEEREAREAEEKKQRDIEMAHEEQERLQRAEEVRYNPRYTDCTFLTTNRVMSLAE